MIFDSQVLQVLTLSLFLGWSIFSRFAVHGHYDVHTHTYTHTNQWVHRNERKTLLKRRGLIVFQNNLIIQISQKNKKFSYFVSCRRWVKHLNARAFNKHCTWQSNSIPFQKVENYAMNYLKLSFYYHRPFLCTVNSIIYPTFNRFDWGLQNITYRISKVIRFRLISLYFSLFLSTIFFISTKYRSQFNSNKLFRSYSPSEKWNSFVPVLCSPG